MAGVTIFAISKGNLDMMIAPVDMHLNFCGIKGSDRQDFQKLYFSSMGVVTNSAEILNSGICMKTCPKPGSPIDSSAANVHSDDKARVDTYNEYYKSYTPPYAYESKSVIDYCMPVPSAF
jgi:hypothetical protein